MTHSLFGPFVIGLLVSLLAGWFLVPVLGRLRARQVISTDAPKSHLAKGGTPTMGGLIILVGGACTALLYPGPNGNPPLLWAVTLCTLAFGGLGLLDDILIIRRGKNLGLRAREKLAGQFALALCFAVYYWLADPSHTRLNESPVSLPAILTLLYHVLLMVGMSNAVNLTDGLDGLAAGVTLPIWSALALLGAFWGLAQHPLGGGVSEDGVVTFCGAFAGATLGYLYYNAHPAQVFMGDTGSLAVGGGIAAAAIGLRMEWIVLVAALVPIIEAGSVTLQVISFKLTRRRIFKMAPLHHHFELCHWPETRVVARFGIASALFAALALMIFFRG